MHALLIGCSFKEGNFKWIENRYFFIGSVFNFSIKSKWQISCICLYANEWHESKTEDSVYDTHLNFRSFFSGKKCALYTGKYRTHNTSFFTCKYRGWNKLKETWRSHFSYRRQNFGQLKQKHFIGNFAKRFLSTTVLSWKQGWVGSQHWECKPSTDVASVWFCHWCHMWAEFVGSALCFEEFFPWFSSLTKYQNLIWFVVI